MRKLKLPVPTTIITGSLGVGVSAQYLSFNQLRPAASPCPLPCLAAMCCLPTRRKRQQSATLSLPSQLRR